MEISVSPNQRRVTIHKMTVKPPYVKIDIDSNKRAMAELGYSAYMLYMYFCMNADGFNLIVSRVAICSQTGMKENTYHAAFRKLVEKGYLVLRDGTKTLYDFYEIPAQVKTSVTSRKNVKDRVGRRPFVDM